MDESVAKASTADISSVSLDDGEDNNSITIKVQSSSRSITYKLSKVHTCWQVFTTVPFLGSFEVLQILNTVTPLIVDWTLWDRSMMIIINFSISIKDTFKVSNNWLPCSFNIFWTSRRGQPLYKGHNSWIYVVPNASFAWRSYCSCTFWQHHVCCCALSQIFSSPRWWCYESFLSSCWLPLLTSTVVDSMLHQLCLR